MTDSLKDCSRESHFCAIAGFISGHAWLPSEWHHLGWLAIAGGLALRSRGWNQGLSELLRHPGGIAAAAFLLWMTARSLLGAVLGDVFPTAEVVRGVVGLALLILLCLLLWEIGNDVGLLRRIGRTSGLICAGAALGSVLIYYVVLDGHLPGERLANAFVHGGQNPVCAGLIFGFHALWLSALVADSTVRRDRVLLWSAVIVLTSAAFLTGSRGPMLALLCGHTVLLVCRGWHRGGMAFTVFVVIASSYLMAAPHFPSVEHQSPMESVLGRADNGRFQIYEAAWKAVSERDALMVGLGEWGSRALWSPHLPPDPSGLMHHLHSVVVATLAAGGVIGISLAAVLVFFVGRAALRRCRSQPIILALLIYGALGLSVDGQTLTSLASLPRFEGLLFWVPAILALRAEGSLVEIRGFEPLTFSLRTRRSTN
jgi:hypothetical protein